jgi:transposase-like protein
MRSGKCPSCGSSNVYTKKWGLEPRRLSGRNQVHHDYICTDCGYCESYYTDKEVLRKIAQQWQKVG